MSTRTLVGAMSLTHDIIEEYGWVSGGEAFENGTMSTANRVRTAEPNGEASSPLLREIQDALAWVRNQEGKNGYILNLQTTLEAIGEGKVSDKALGLIVSILPVYRKQVERDAKNAEENANKPESNWVGEVGKRDTFTLTCEDIREMDGAFGQSYLHKFADADGNELVWFATSGACTNRVKGMTGWGEPVPMYEVGKTYTVKATVKKHGEFRERKSTTINRVKQV